MATRLCLVFETANVARMTESLKRDTVSPRRRLERVLLDVALYDELAETRGFGDVAEQASRHGISRPHWYEIRAGRREPGAALALRVAEQLGVQPRVIWHREAVSADA